MALRFCIKERFSIVNLSLGIDLPKSTPVRPTDTKSILDLYELCDEAFVNGVVSGGGPQRRHAALSRQSKVVDRRRTRRVRRPERLESATTSEHGSSRLASTWWPRRGRRRAQVDRDELRVPARGGPCGSHRHAHAQLDPLVIRAELHRAARRFASRSSAHEPFDLLSDGSARLRAALASATTVG
jgi:hypothetical protein